jgi:hypothetical protein
MFKKSLLALAVSAVALNATAADIAITGTTVSLEGAVNETSIAVPSAVVTLAAEYTVNDTVTFTISGAEFDTAASSPVLTAALNGGDTATLGLLSLDANTATFRITANTDGGADGVIYTGGTFTLTGMQMKTSTVVDATGDINISYAAKTNTGLTLDNLGTATDVAATVVEQYSSSVTKKLNGVVDVNNGRKLFTVGDDNTTTDVLIVTPAEAAAATAAATYTGATHVIHGDFSWMDADDSGDVSAAELAAAFSIAGADTYTSVINSAMDAITVTVADAGGNTVEAMTATFTIPGNVVLSTQSFTVDSTIKYTPATGSATTKAVQTGESAGAWTLNGSVVTVPYMPFGDNTNVILRATNTGTQTGAMSVRYMLEGVDTSWNTLSSEVATIAPGVTNIRDAVMNAIMADAGVTKGKVAIEFTTNVPTGDLTVYAAYKVTTDNDRGFVGTFGQHGSAN